MNECARSYAASNLSFRAKKQKYKAFSTLIERNLM